MAQAKSLLIQGSNRGAAASTLAATSFGKYRIHLAQTRCFASIPHFIPVLFSIDLMRYAAQKLSSQI